MLDTVRTDHSKMPSIKQCYAELLINVRIISIFVSVDGASEGSVTINFGHDRCTATVDFGGQEVSMWLPARVAAVRASALTLSISGLGEATARLPLDETWTRSLDEPASPWSAADLRDAECAHCVTCNTDIVNPGVISAWKDLPSENWAEMMDFWHCHKPEVPNADEADGSIKQKGYSASNKLTAQAGIGMIDVSDLLLAVESCTNVIVGHHQPISI